MYVMSLLSSRISRAPALLTSRFGGIPVAPTTLKMMRDGGVHAPLPIQAAAMPRILLRESVAIHAQTGSGKTLAYLLPLMARLVPDEPRQVLVVVPSSHLAYQTVQVARRLAPPGIGVGLLQRTATASQPETVLVTTGKDLGGLLPMLLRDERKLQHELRTTLQAVVLDEPDAIFAPPLHRRRGHSRPQPTRSPPAVHLPRTRHGGPSVLRGRPLMCRGAPVSVSQPAQPRQAQQVAAAPARRARAAAAARAAAQTAGGDGAAAARPRLGHAEPPHDA
jgi:hypothetical protein